MVIIFNGPGHLVMWLVKMYEVEMITIYGIKNCDTMKKTFHWFDDHDVTYVFHDYKKQGVDEEVLKRAIDTHGWETVINKRGTTWRKLPLEVQDSMDATKALFVAKENASLIKRPLIVSDEGIHIGYGVDAFAKMA